MATYNYPGDFITFQSALDAVASGVVGNGDRLLLAGGTYSGNLTITDITKKGWTIEGVSKDGVVWEYDSSKTSPAVSITNTGGWTIKNLTLKAKAKVVEITYPGYTGGGASFTAGDGYNLENLDIWATDPDDDYEMVLVLNDAYRESDPYFGPVTAGKVDRCNFYQTSYTERMCPLRIYGAIGKYGTGAPSDDANCGIIRSCNFVDTLGLRIGRYYTGSGDSYRPVLPLIENCFFKTYGYGIYLDCVYGPQTSSAVGQYLISNCTFDSVIGTSPEAGLVGSTTAAIFCGWGYGHYTNIVGGLRPGGYVITKNCSITNNVAGLFSQDGSGPNAGAGKDGYDLIKTYNCNFYNNTADKTQNEAGGLGDPAATIDIADSSNLTSSDPLYINQGGSSRFDYRISVGSPLINVGNGNASSYQWFTDGFKCAQVNIEDSGIVDIGVHSIFVLTALAGQLGHYTWIIDEIMLEEADSKIAASTYVRPFTTDQNNHGIETNAFSSEFIDEFIQLVAYCLGTSFLPPRFEVVRGELNDNSKRIIKRMRKRFLEMYDYANRNNVAAGLSLPTIPVAPEFEPETEV